MAPSCTILEYLSRPNPKLSYHLRGGGSSTLNMNHVWLPIEGFRPWSEFTFNNLNAKYKTSLTKLITPYDPAQLIRYGRLQDIVNEDTVTTLVTVNNLLPVNNALYETEKGLHYGPGSKFFTQQPDGLPDWGLGVDRVMNEGLQTLRNFCPGDLKTYSKWNANGVLDKDWSCYLEKEALVNQAKPFEQAQYYATSLGTRYTWILTDAELIVIRISTSKDAPRSPRHLRETSYHSVPGTSTLSPTFSSMSTDHSTFSGHSGSSSGINPAPLEIARISWSAGSKKQSKGQEPEMTINLALYFLARLALEDCSISTSYPPINPKSPKVQHTLPPIPEADPSNMTKYWTPSRGISWDVIRTDIKIYIPGASVEQWQNEEGKPGYCIRAIEKVGKDELTAMLADLKADTSAWQMEGGEYSKSQVHKSRYYYGGTYRG